MSHKKVFILFVSVWVVCKVRIVESVETDDCGIRNEDRLGLDNVLISDQFNKACNATRNQRIEPRENSLHQSIYDLIPDVSIYKLINQRIKDSNCRRDAEILLDRIQHLDLWALKMMDSSGKMGSGLLNGNVNQLGDFDQCLSVNSNTDSWDIENTVEKGNKLATDITGKYCLAFLDVKVPNNYHMDQLLHSYGAIVSNLSDPGHRVARFSTVSWGFCLPSSCSSQDLQQWVSDMWSNNTDVSIQVKVDSDMCYTTEKEPYSLAKTMTYVLFLAILFMAVIGSFLKEEDNNNKALKSNNVSVMQVVRSFSLRKNLSTLFDTSTSAEDIKCLHGIRGLSALCLIIFHKSAAIMFNPYANRTAMANSLGLAWSVIGRTAIIYTDSFILLSGLLTSYIFIKDLDKKGKINVKDKYWTRFFRIVPNLVAVILFCTYVMVDMGSGPQWNLVVKHHSDLCKINMWRNLMFIHNYFGFENMCLTHTHQLGIDMQLFLVAPFVVWLLWRHMRVGLLAVLSLGVLSTILRFTVAIDKQLSPVLYFGATVSQMFDTANLSYILPTHRATVYLMGILMGYMLRRVKNMTFNKFQLTFMYVLGLCLGAYAMCGPYEMARRDYVYSALDAAKWNAFAPIMWSTMICLCIVVCTFGYGGFLNDILSWRGFVVFTRMAYGVYLTQFPVYFYNVGSQRTPEYYSPFMLFNFGEVGVIMLASVTLTVLVDLPFQSIKKLSWNASTSNKMDIKADSREELSPNNNKMAEAQNVQTVKQRRHKDVAKRMTLGSRTG